VIHHDVTDSELPPPAPGSRIVVVKHIAAVGQTGTLIELVDEDEWRARMDHGNHLKLKTNDFRTAAPPVASVYIRDRIEFVPMFRSEEPTATYRAESNAQHILEETAKLLKIYSSTIISIEGHTATPDDRMDDWAHALAQGRADKIKSDFVDLGIEADRLKPIGLPGKLGSRHHDTLFRITSI